MRFKLIILLRLYALSLSSWRLYGEQGQNLIKVAEHSFGSLWVYSFAKSWQEKGCSSQAETFERFWLTGKIWRFHSFHGNMNDWIQP